MYKGRVFLSGRFLVNLIDNKYKSLALTRVKPCQGELCRKEGHNQHNCRYELIIYQNGRWIVSSRQGKEYYKKLSDAINIYLASLLRKVPDEKQRLEIEQVLLQGPFYNHESLIIAIEAIVTCAIKAPENYPHMIRMLQSPKINYRLHNQNAPYVLLSILYGSKFTAQAIANNLTGQLGLYHFRKSDIYDEDLKRVIGYGHNENEIISKIQEQVLSLKPKTYEEYIEEEGTLPF